MYVLYNQVDMNLYLKKKNQINFLFQLSGWQRYAKWDGYFRFLGLLFFGWDENSFGMKGRNW